LLKVEKVSLAEELPTATTLEPPAADEGEKPAESVPQLLSAVLPIATTTCSPPVVREEVIAFSAEE
jgi:hypothetical protein